jgi:hypothetical protein
MILSFFGSTAAANCWETVAATDGIQLITIGHG